MLNSRDASFGVAGVGTTLAVLYAAQISRDAQHRRDDDRRRRHLRGAGDRAARRPVKSPWYLFLGTCLSFLVGMVLRPWSTEQEGVGGLRRRRLHVSGYVDARAGALGDAAPARPGAARGHGRRHRAPRHGPARGGAARAAGDARAATGPSSSRCSPGLYPLLDVVILLLVLNLAFSTATRLASLPVRGRDDGRAVRRGPRLRLDRRRRAGSPARRCWTCRSSSASPAWRRRRCTRAGRTCSTSSRGRCRRGRCRGWR